MSKKEEFIKMVESVIDYIEENAFDNTDSIYYSKNALDYFEEFKNQKETESSRTAFTENGLKVLQFMQENHQKFNNLMNAKEIGEGLFISSRSVSGAIRKLVTDGYVTKSGNNPVVYSITDLGLNQKLALNEN